MNFCQASHLTLFIIAWSISFVNRFLKFSLYLFCVQNQSGTSMLTLAPATEHPSNAEIHSVPTGIIKPKWYRNDA